MTRQPNAASASVSTRTKVPREQDPRNPNHRIADFLDDGSVELITNDDDSGMLAATGTVGGQPIVVFASDATIMGGAMGVAGCKVVVTAYERALADEVPVVGLWHSGGARLPEGVVSLHAVGEVFAIMTRASGKIPQISVVIGAAAGGAAYGPALTDIVILAPEGRIFVTGPDVVRSVTGEDVDALRLGGPEPHGRRSGVVHVLADSLEDAFDRARAITRLLDPATQGTFDVSGIEDRDLSASLPESAKRAYDVHPLVEDLLVALVLAAGGDHRLEGVDDLQRLLDPSAHQEVGHHRGRRLADRAPLCVVGHILHGGQILGQAQPQRQRVTARRVDVVHLGAEGLPQPAVVRVAVVVEDDLLVHLLEFHFRPPPSTSKNSWARRRDRANVSTSSSVLYSANDARTVDWTPRRRCSGHAQWCPTRTATPSSSSTWLTSWAWMPSTTKETAPPRETMSVGPTIRTPGICCSASRAATVSASSWRAMVSIVCPCR